MLGTAAIDDALTAAAFTRRWPSARDPCTSTCTGIRGVIRYTTPHDRTNYLGGRQPHVSFRLNNIEEDACHRHTSTHASPFLLSRFVQHGTIKGRAKRLASSPELSIACHHGKKTALSAQILDLR
jgi:hypothetical protein